MPTVIVSGVTVTHTWDDERKEKITINRGRFDDTGPYVVITDDSGNEIYFRPESWPEVRDQVDSMFDAITAEKADS